MSSQDMSSRATELNDQAQMKKEEITTKAAEACRSASQSCQEIKEQAGCYIQKGCEQVSNIAKGAVTAAGNALGAGSDPAARR